MTILQRLGLRPVTPIVEIDPPEGAVAPANNPILEPAPVLRLTATDLWATFHDNAAEAEAHLGGQAVVVAGMVARVERDAAHFVVALAVQGGHGTVRCAFTTAQGGDLHPLRPGQLVLVSGQHPKLRYGDVVLADCVLVEPDLTVATGDHAA